MGDTGSVILVMGLAMPPCRILSQESAEDQAVIAIEAKQSTLTRFVLHGLLHFARNDALGPAAFILTGASSQAAPCFT
jgi:hypothetical protein